MTAFTIHPIADADRPVTLAFISEHWGLPIVSRGIAHPAHEYPGFIAWKSGRIAGLITYHIAGDQCEITTLDSIMEGLGIGTALIQQVSEAARAAGSRRLWLITTNDNVNALRFYQKRHFELVAVHRRAIEQSRQIKPSIPPLGFDGIPIRDEIELEIRL